MKLKKNIKKISNKGGINVLRNIVIFVVGSFVIPKLAFAADGNSQAQIVLYMILTMFAMGVIGIVASIAASAFGDGRIGNIIKNGSFLGCVAIFVGIAGIVMDGVASLIYKALKFVS